MFARVSTYKGSPGRSVEASRQIEETTDRLRAMTGFAGAYLLIDNTSGKALTITLWDSAEAMQASAAAANPLRDMVAQTLGAAEPPSVEMFEVASRI